VIVANVDQMLIVGSAAERCSTHICIDRSWSRRRKRIRPVICINKIDLVDPADLQPLVGVVWPDGLPGADGCPRRTDSALIVCGASWPIQQRRDAGQSGGGQSSAGSM